MRQIILTSCLSVLVIIGCNTKNVINDERLCDESSISNPEELTLDTVQFKNIKLTYKPKVFYEDKSIRKEVVLDYDSSITIYLQNKLTKTSKWLYYKKLILQKEINVFKLKNDDGFNYLYIDKTRYYDKKGQIIKVVDHRQKDKYPICYRQAYMLVEKWKPKDYQVNGIDRNFIVNKKDTTYTWDVHIKHPVKARNEAKAFLYTIDAKTGKKLKKVETRLGTNDDL